MWGMQYSNSGNLITLRCATPSVRFQVVGEDSNAAKESFDSFVLLQKLRAPPQETPKPAVGKPSNLTPGEQLNRLFERYMPAAKDTSSLPVGRTSSLGGGSQRLQQRQPGAWRLTIEETGRFLRSFSGPLNTQQVATMVSTVVGSAGMYVNFQEFIALCCAYLPIVPCLDYLSAYLESDKTGSGLLSGRAAAQLLDRCGFKNAARRLRQEAPNYITYPHFLYLTRARGAGAVASASGITKPLVTKPRL